MTAGNTISIIIPAYNEADNLSATIDEVIASVQDEFDGYEILIFDDASIDRTAEIADIIALSNNNIRVFHNKINQGLGWNYKSGIRIAKMKYVILVNGKHDIFAEQLRNIFIHRHKAQIVVPWHTNDNERSVFRQIVSRAYTTLLNIVFGYRLHYYNDSVLYHTSTIRSLHIRTNSYAFSAETLIKALSLGNSFIEVPIRNFYLSGVKTNAFRLKNIYGVACFLFWIFWDVYINNTFGDE